MIPCVLFEDEDLLVVNKPAGLNTHAPSPFSGEGLYEWLRHREPRWADLAILHRLDKETSGVLVFGKTSRANRALADQFAQRQIKKQYLLLTDHLPAQHDFTVKSNLRRIGERYTGGIHGAAAETRFRRLNLKFQIQDFKVLEAEPLTGRTHQIRVHAAESGFPIVGDIKYGGAPYARVCLHAAALELRHPATERKLIFRAPVDFSDDPHLGLRAALLDAWETDACRLVHGAADGWPGWYVDRLGDFLLSQSAQALGQREREFLRQRITAKKPALAPGDSPTAVEGADGHRARNSPTGAYHKTLTRQIRRTVPESASPQWVLGTSAPDRFIVHENAVAFELSFREGYSTGLFLDQRYNRRRLLTGHVAAGFTLMPANGTKQRRADPVQARPNPKPPAAHPAAMQALAGFELLNVFAYTCGFSVCGALAGARTVSLDLSKKYLDWGRRNFRLNGIDPAAHDFIYGDALNWLHRLAKKRRNFNLVLLDPPTFSQSKHRGAFRVEKDYARLVRAALPLLKPGAVLFASTNAANWPPQAFLSSVKAAISQADRKILQEQYVPQPPDFPVSRSEPAYLKTVWMRLS